MRIFSTWLVTTSCLSILTFGLLVQRNAQSWAKSWGDGLQMSVYINPEERPVEEIQAQIQALPEIQSVKIISAQDSFNDFKSQMASYGSLTINADEIVQAIPTSLLVEVKSDQEANMKFSILQTAADKIRSIAGVQSAEYGQSWVQKFSEIVEGLRFMGLLLGALLFVTASYVIFNSIRILVLEKKNEIEILELLGADSRFIQLPFLKQGLIIGGLSAIAAVAINAGIVALLQNSMANHAVLLPFVSQVQSIQPGMAFMTLALGSVLGFVSAFLCVRKINTGWLAAGQM